ncbi:MAG: hypothetical protein A3F82_08880 [Deltaproteobacteria bacterium RIFCSPLOWO2_12_FULL_44_12]|nr:MAG: hypothetical protein A3F82_08880 [Deltaproteobacteria bacterium RIFCSPLOWO2_12_FULL_44_12]
MTPIPKPIHSICILPWISFDEKYTINGASLIPVRTTQFEDFPAALKMILSSYVDMIGRPIEQCSLLTLEGNDPVWNIKPSDDQQVMKAMALFFLSSFSCNDYFTYGAYVNASAFQPIFQEFQIPLRGLLFRRRRRDGFISSGGLEHGEVKLSVPLECAFLEPKMDEKFLEALRKLKEKESKLSRRISTALSFFRLANTDQAHMSIDAEVILMGAAFEALFDAKGKEQVACRYEEYFKNYKSKIVEDALAVRTEIKWDEENKEKEARERQWQLGRKFIQELHRRRSKYIHGNDVSKKSWGWSPDEHLVMGAFIFPLAVKLLLEKVELYSLTNEDRKACKAIDIILAKTDWKSSWQSSLIRDAFWSSLSKEPLGNVSG